MIIKIIFLILLIFLSGFFSGSETAFMSLGKFKTKEYINKKKRNFEIVQKLKEDQSKLISTILIGNNLVNIAAASLATLLGSEIFSNIGFNFTESITAGIVTGIMTLVVLIFGEVIPKNNAANNYEKIVSKSAKTIYILSILFFPLIWILNLIHNVIIKDSKIDFEQKVTEEEIKTIVNVGSDEGGIDSYEKHLIHKIFQFDDKIVKEIMTPRMKTITVEANVKIKDIIKLMNKEGFSRVPVYKNSPDNIVGLFHMRDVLDAVQKNKLNKPVKTICTKPFFVPESKPIDDLFKDMQKNKLQLVIVVDEFGGFSGIASMEDLLEEIVGEIYDEDEQRTNNIRETSKNEYKVDGESTIREIKELLKLKFLDAMDSETIGSYVLSKLGHIPKKGEEIQLKKGKIIIDTVTDTTVKKIIIKL
jgi:putative hemolysin